MREKEVELLRCIGRWKAVASSKFEVRRKKERKVEQTFCDLQSEPLGTVTSEFLNHSAVVSFIDKSYDQNLKFWYFIQTSSLDIIEGKIKEHVAKYQEDCKRGLGMPPGELYSHLLIRSIYLSGNQELIDIFCRYLPIPSADIFEGYEVPHVVSDKKNVVVQSVKDFQQRNQDQGLSLDEITDNVVDIQRTIRSNLRYDEEINRIADRKRWKFLTEKVSPEELIQDANTPYRPKCEPQLARRIMELAQKVRLFSTVRHLTSAAHIGGIFDDCLYGRRRLLQDFKLFRQASLHECDIAEGDGNVICFGPSEIDPDAMQPNTIELLFDVDKISKNNPSIFYKQQDLHFLRGKLRHIVVNSRNSKQKSKQLFFSHTSFVRNKIEGFSYLSVYDGFSGGLKAQVSLPNYSLISYNVQNIHQILTLNFFRFLDSSFDRENNFKSVRDEVYADLGELSDEELVAFLQEMGKKLSDTSEFNFYGVHQIDFSTMIAMSSYRDGHEVSYTLNLDKLVASLERNDITILNEARKHLPGAFSSYRFLDYLLSKTTSILGRYELQKLRAKCKAPFWVEPVAEPEPLTAEAIAQYTPASDSIDVTKDHNELDQAKKEVNEPASQGGYSNAESQKVAYEIRSIPPKVDTAVSKHNTEEQQSHQPIASDAVPPLQLIEENTVGNNQNFSEAWKIAEDIKNGIEKLHKESLSNSEIGLLNETSSAVNCALNDPTEDTLKTCLVFAEKIEKSSLGKKLAGLLLMFVGALGVATGILLSIGGTAATFGLAAPLSVGAGVGIGIGGASLFGAGSFLFFNECRKDHSQANDSSEKITNFTEALETPALT